MERPAFSIPSSMEGLPGFSGRASPSGRSIRWSPGVQQHSVSRREQMLLRALQQTTDALSKAGPKDPAPSYGAIDSQPFNRAIMSLFRRKMVAAIGSDTDAQGWGVLLSNCCKLYGLVL